MSNALHILHLLESSPARAKFPFLSLPLSLGRTGTQENDIIVEQATKGISNHLQLGWALLLRQPFHNIQAGCVCVCVSRLLYILYGLILFLLRHWKAPNIAEPNFSTTDRPTRSSVGLLNYLFTSHRLWRSFSILSCEMYEKRLTGKIWRLLKL